MNLKRLRSYLRILIYGKHYDDRLTASCNLLTELDDGTHDNWLAVQRAGQLLHDMLRARKWKERRKYARYLEKMLFEEEGK